MHQSGLVSSLAADSGSLQEAQTDRQTDSSAFSHRLLRCKLLWLKAKNFFFHYETKYTVIFFIPKKESKEVSSARLVWAECGSAMLHQHLPFHREVEIQDLCLPLSPKAG